MLTAPFGCLSLSKAKFMAAASWIDMLEVDMVQVGRGSTVGPGSRSEAGFTLSKTDRMVTLILLGNSAPRMDTYQLVTKGWLEQI